MNIAVIESPTRLSLTRSFDATPEVLFDAWLAQSWADWLGPEGIVGVSCQIDPRVGGAWRILSRSPDGREIVHNGVYKEITRPSRLVFTWNGSCHPGMNETIVTLTFKAKGAGTEMTLTHEGFLDNEVRDGHNQGWNATFDRLARQLA